LAAVLDLSHFPEPSNETVVPDLARSGDRANSAAEGGRHARVLPLRHVLDQIGSSWVADEDGEPFLVLVDEDAFHGQRVEPAGGCKSAREERASVELAEELAADLDPFGRGHREQVHEGPAGDERCHQPAQDVHDALRLHSSERPGEEDEIDALLLDLDLQYGTVALSLDIEPTRGLREVLENPARIDSLFISSATTKIGERFSVMAAEEAVDEDFRYDASAIDLLLDELRRQSHCVIVDIPRTVAATRVRVLSAATDAIVVTELTLAGLRDSIRLNGLIQQVAAKARTTFIANRVGAKENGVSKVEFEKALGRSIDILLPEQGRAVAAAASSGKALAAVASSNKIVALLRTVAAGLAETRTGKAAKRRGFWRRGRS